MIAAALRFSVLGHPAQLERPELLWLALVALAAGGVIALGLLARRRTLVVTIRDGRLVPRVASGLSPGRTVLRGAATTLGLLLLAVALAGPQWGQKAELVKRVGLDLVVAVDASRSMLARDVKPSRLERARLELSDLLDRLHGDRVGIVVFAGEAFVQCPLTTDYGAARLFLRAIDPTAMPAQGTAVAAALRTAGEMLTSADRGAKTQVVLLITDGEDHEGDVEAAAEKLKEDGVRVYTLGVGTPSGSPIPVLDPRTGAVQDYLRDDAGNTVMSRLEEGQLSSIAATTGGKHLRGTGADMGMGEVMAELDQLEKSEFESRLSVQFATVYEWFAAPALLLLVLGALVPEGRRAAAVALLALLGLPGTASAGLLERPDPDVEAGNEAYASGDAAGALEAYTRAAERGPSAIVDFDRGAALIAAGRFEEARGALQSALKAPGADAIAGKVYANLGQAFAGLKQRDEAMAAYRRALELDPSDAKARHDLEVLLLQKQNEEQEQQEQQQPQEEQQEQQAGKDPQDQQEQEQQQAGEDPQEQQAGNEEQEQQEGKQAGKDPQEQPSGGQQEEQQQAGEDPQQQPSDEPEPREGEERQAAAAQAQAQEKDDGKLDSRARLLLDALRDGEKSFQLWRQQKQKRTSDAKQDW